MKNSFFLLEWAEQLPLDENLLPSYYVKLHDEGIFSASLTEAAERTDGGHTSQMSALACERTYEIPYNFDDPENENTIYSLYDKIEALIPQTIMDSFMAQRDPYIESYAGEW